MHLLGYVLRLIYEVDGVPQIPGNILKIKP